MKSAKKGFAFVVALYMLLLFCLSCEQNNHPNSGFVAGYKAPVSDTLWHAPDTLLIGQEPNAGLIRYGKNLVANTAYYLGPKGVVASMSNGMNCQNCHQQAGTRPFGSNFGMVASAYPRFSPRSGTLENIYTRINDCMQRSLDGKAIDSNSKEMKAFTAYIIWVGKDVPKGKKPSGSGALQLALLDRAADVANGKNIYIQKCALCHGKNGGGMPNTNGTGFQYPPLWGKDSYNNGAGMYRLTRIATYIKYNMPFGVTFQAPQLTNEEAWDIAAYIDSQPRPGFDAHADWPDIKTKPIDYPFGPYADNFTETQHKYGPFKPIAEAKKQQSQKKNM